jgi:hypothetical protein
VLLSSPRSMSASVHVNWVTPTKIRTVRVTGTHAAMPPSASWPHRIKGRLLSRRHQVEVAFGAPLVPRPDETPAQLMARVSAAYSTDDPPRPGSTT